MKANTFLKRVCARFPIVAVAISATGVLGYAALGSAQAAPAAECWATVGSAGTVDEADSGIVALSSNTVAVSSGVAVGTVNIRYNIVATRGLFEGDKNFLSMAARVADNGPAAQAVIRVQRMNISTGVIGTLGQLDTNNFPPSTVAEKREIGMNCQGPALDFRNNVYFADVELIKTASGGNPLLRAISICGVIC